eukprot:2982393-Amphidinium_carterae.2
MPVLPPQVSRLLQKPPLGYAAARHYGVRSTAPGQDLRRRPRMVTFPLKPYNLRSSCPCNATRNAGASTPPSCAATPKGMS